MADILLKDKDGVPQPYTNVNSVTFNTTTPGETATFIAQKQADWNQTDTTAVDYIKNKPQDLATKDFVESHVQEKIDAIGIQEGVATEEYVQEYVQEQISNIEIPDTQVQADWLQNDETAADHILNRPFYEKDDTIKQLDNKYLSILDYEAGSETYKIKAEHLPEIDALPSVTAEDDGKVLGVVDGEWSKVDAPSGGTGGGDTSKIPIEVDVYQTTELSNFTFNSTYKAYGQSFDVDFVLKVGSTYQVVWDGGTYECVGQDCSALMAGCVVLGNVANWGLSGNDEPFAIGWIDGYAMFFSTVDTTAGVVHNVRIFQTGAAVADWEQNDINGEGYIHNRPCFVGDPVLKTIIPTDELPFEIMDGMYGFQSTPTSDMIEFWNSDWETVSFMWDGQEYICKPKMLEGVIKFIGNVCLVTGGEDTGEPFAGALIGAEFGGQDLMIIMSAVDAPTDILSYQTLTFAAVEGTNYYSTNVDALSFVEGEPYYVEFNNNQYYDPIATSYELDGVTYIGVGNPSILGLGASNGYAFFAYTSGGTSAVVTTDVIESCPVQVSHTPVVKHTIGMSGFVENIKTLDSKFIGDVPWGKVTNKPFGVISAGAVVADESIVVSGELTQLTTLNAGNIVIDAQYDIVVNNIWYNGVGMSLGGMTGIMIANGSNEEVGAIVIEYGGLIVMSDTFITPGVPTDIKVTLSEDAIKKIDAQYLPDDLSGGSDLPEVGAEGQVMTVVNGAWAASAITYPTELPTVSTSDAGKFLRVSSAGVWVAETVTNAEEVTF